MIRKILNKLFLNKAKPFYSPFLYWFCRNYVDIYNGDGDQNRETNGGWKWLKKYIKTKPKIIFDVGVFDGGYAQKIYEYDPNVKVYAFEPNPKTFKRLNKLKGNTYEKLALSDFEGNTTLYTSKEFEAMDSLYYRNKCRGLHTGKYNIKCTTVDKYCEQNKINHIDLLKIDTEGNDLNVIKGAERMIKSGNIDTIQFEFNLLYTFSHIYFNDFYDYLTKFKYALYKVKHEGLKRVDDPVLERTTYAYFVAKKLTK